MEEESKEEYLARLRKERQTEDPAGLEEETTEEEKQPLTFKARLKSLLLFLLFTLFLYALYLIFGMMKGN